VYTNTKACPLSIVGRTHNIFRIPTCALYHALQNCDDFEISSAQIIERHRPKRAFLVDFVTDYQWRHQKQIIGPCQGQLVEVKNGKLDLKKK